MGSSKTAQALMCKFNYEQKGYKVLLLKPEIDTRFENVDEKPIVKSRIGLYCECTVFHKDTNIFVLAEKS